MTIVNKKEERGSAFPYPQLLDEKFWQKIEEYLPERFACVNGTITKDGGSEEIQMQEIHVPTLSLSTFLPATANAEHFKGFKGKALTTAGIIDIETGYSLLRNSRMVFSTSSQTQYVSYETNSITLRPEDVQEPEAVAILPIYRVRIMGDRFVQVSPNSNSRVFSEMDVGGEKVWWLDFEAARINALSGAKGILLGKEDPSETISWMVRMASGVFFDEPIRIHFSKSFKPVRIVIKFKIKKQEDAQSRILYFSNPGTLKEFVEKCFGKFKQFESDPWKLKEIAGWFCLIFETNYIETKALHCSVLLEAMKSRFAESVGYNFDRWQWKDTSGNVKKFLPLVKELAEANELQIPQNLGDTVKEIRHKIVHEGKVSKNLDDIFDMVDLVAAILLKMIDYGHNDMIWNRKKQRSSTFDEYLKDMGLI